MFFDNYSVNLVADTR